MKLCISDIDKSTIAEAKSTTSVLDTVQALIDTMADAYFQGAHYLVLYEENLMPDFFDLKTGVAGEALQKFSTYQMKLIIIGEFDKFDSNSLQAFIAESNRGNQIAFVASKEAALEKIFNAV